MTAPTDKLVHVTFDAPDDVLAQHIYRDPGITAQTQRLATTAWGEARAARVENYMDAVDAVWRGVVQRAHAAKGTLQELRLALAAFAAMQAIKRFTVVEQQIFAGTSLQQQVHVQKFGINWAEQLRADQRALLARDPAGAWLQGLVDADNAAIQQRQHEAHEAQHAAWHARRPAVWLASVRKRGIDVTLEGGAVTVSAAAPLTEAERAEAAEVRAEIVAILQGELEAAELASRRVAL